MTMIERGTTRGYGSAAAVVKPAASFTRRANNAHGVIFSKNIASS